MEIEIDRSVINEIEKTLPDLATWLGKHTVHFGTSAVILTAITNELDKLKEQFEEDQGIEGQMSIEEVFDQG